MLVTIMMAALVLGPAAAAPAVETLAWLEGTWAGEKDGVHSDEVWTSAHGGALLGVHRDVKGGRMVSWEFLRIQAAGTGVTLFASPQSAPPTPFTLVESGGKRAVFENKAHDFPQRILYWMDSAGALHARIEGPQGDKTVAEEWVWTRSH